MLTGSVEAAARFSTRTTSADAIDHEIENLPSRALALLETALCPDSTKRFTSAAAFRAAIAEVSRELTPL
jgi:hypothetical protein